MPGLGRRLDRIEERYPAAPARSAGIDPAVHRAWLEARSDAELELMETAAEHLEAGGDPADLGAEACEEMARIMGTWETFTAEARSCEP